MEFSRNNLRLYLNPKLLVIPLVELMNFHFTLQDWIAIGLIVLGSFWVAFRSSASKLIVNRLDGKKKKDRGVLTGRNEEDVFTEKKSVIQRVRSKMNEIILIYIHVYF